MRRGVGVGAIKDKKAAQEKFREKKEILDENLLEEMAKQLDQFRTNLEDFAKKHQGLIKKNPTFRESFHEMCATIGVDPLASSKGFWSELLGLGSFYYPIAIKAVEVVLSTAQSHGGVMTVHEILRRLNKMKAKSDEEITSDDLFQAIRSLEGLGKSCCIVPGRKNRPEEALVYCIPEELSLDNTMVIQYMSQSRTLFVTADQLISKMDWTTKRVTAALDRLTREGVVWIDDYKGQRAYWFPSLFYSKHYNRRSKSVK